MYHYYVLLPSHFPFHWSLALPTPRRRLRRTAAVPLLLLRRIHRSTPRRGANLCTPLCWICIGSRDCSSLCRSAELPEQMVGFGSLAPKTKNLVVGGGLTGFVFGVYYYTMRAVGSTDELQVAIDKFEDLKKKDADATPAANPSTPGSS